MARRRRVDRDLRAIRERRYRLRAQTSRFIPDADSDFAHMARNFAGYIERHAARLPLSPQQVADLFGGVQKFRDALSRTITPSTAGPRATLQKNEARAEAEKVLRAAARVLRADASLDSVDRMTLNLHEPAKRLKRRECPQIAPVLKYVRAIDASSGIPGRHVLEYMNDFDNKRGAKPHGAARLELFVELVPPELAAAGPSGAGIPAFPGQLSGGRLWYLRSFTNSRFEVEYPVMADGTPMLVVYWGRWADAKGNVGPFSKTCVARVEGWTSPVVLLGGSRGNQRVEAKKIVFMQTPYALTDHLEGDAVAAELRRLGQPRLLDAA